MLIIYSEAEFKEFEQPLKVEPWLKYHWFHLKLHSVFQDLSRRSIFWGFETRLKFIKFGIWIYYFSSKSMKTVGQLGPNVSWNLTYNPSALNLRKSIVMNTSIGNPISWMGSDSFVDTNNCVQKHHFMWFLDIFILFSDFLN